ncbi:MAG: hypothetical protein ACMXYE_00235 [Candidatus Woesearchaeota archaeon]
MKKTNTIFGICVLAVISLILTGCGPSTSGSVTDYRTGSQGLEISFMRNAPPSSMYAEDESFSALVEIHNRGVFPGDRDGDLIADIHFTGFDRNIIQGLERTSVTFREEEARTRYNPEGGYQVATLEGRVNQATFMNSRIDRYDATIRATICYPYKTFASVDVCIDPNPNRASGSNECRPGITSAGSQGAPIAVTSVETIAQRGAARFVITVANVGGGEVILPEYLGQCTEPSTTRTEYDKIRIVNADLSGTIPLDCTPSDTINLVNNRATIVCRADNIDESGTAYKTLLNLEIDYGYKKAIQRTMQIRGD